MKQIPEEFYKLKTSGAEHHPRARTVAELIGHLKKLPGKTKVKTSFSNSVELVVYNHGEHTEYLCVNDNDDDQLF